MIITKDHDISINIPTIKQCLSFMDDFAMLDNIRRHSLMVAGTAKALLTGLRRAEETSAPLPPDSLVVAGALMHDIAKTQCLKEMCKHAEVGQEICRDLGFPEIGEIVREHVVLSDFSRDRYRQGIFNAKELVYYADKRVRHDTIVTLEDRLAYILERYGDKNPVKEMMITANFQRCQEFEQHLFSFLDFLPAELPDFVTDTLSFKNPE
jgi:putative nucleotidyltransferase with HDIG domain